ILKLMARGYSIEEVKKCLIKLKREFSSVKIKTYILVGFPTESEEDFKETLKLIEDVEFDNIDFFRYSRTPGNPAYYMEGQIDENVKAKRLKKIRDIMVDGKKYLCVFESEGKVLKFSRELTSPLL
ncbi:MAG: hypothetical protein JSV39_03240, partial [Candidatus Aenigmatarchaeota archaeon]